jgi:hypothetical protein
MGGINAHFAMRAGSPRLTRKRVIVDAAVLVPEDSQQGLFPQRGIPNCLEHVCNQHVSQADIVVGVLVVCRFEGKAEIAGLDEAVMGQVPPSCVSQKLLKKLESVPEYIYAKTLQGEGLRKVVKVDFAGARGFFQTVINGGDVAVIQLVGDMAVGGGGVYEYAVRPSLAWQRGIPRIADRKLAGESGQGWKTAGSEATHDLVGVRE